jgi:hypothetical protein
MSGIVQRLFDIVQFSGCFLPIDLAASLKNKELQVGMLIALNASKTNRRNSQ